jgi:simple sugar transport system permease protein
MEVLTTLGNYLAAALRTATPGLLAALGLLLMNRSGVSNIGAEGIMLIATFMAVMGTYYTKSVWRGLLLAMASGALMGLLFAFLTVTIRANQIVVGAAFNILGSGVSAMLYRIVFGMSTEVITIEGFNALNIPALSNIPLIGPAFFSHMPMVYIAFLLVPVVSYYLFKTPSGLTSVLSAKPQGGGYAGRARLPHTLCGGGRGGMLIAAGGAFLSTGLLRFLLGGYGGGTRIYRTGGGHIRQI